MKNIIVTGYPKSGNTWVTKLVAELIQCQSKGFYGGGNSDLSIDGEDRQSEFVCYKSHLEYRALAEDENVDFIICVIRDPRDIVVSGAHYFRRLWAVTSKRWKGSLLGRTLNRIYWEVFARRKMLAEMTRAVSDGNDWIHLWCSVSWRNHVEPFVKTKSTNVLYIRYEDLLQDAPKACQAILNLVDVKRTESQILAAIENQSFQNLKAKFAKDERQRELGFLRKGASGDWKSKLSSAQVAQIQLGASDMLEFLGYDIED